MVETVTQSWQIRVPTAEAAKHELHSKHLLSLQKAVVGFVSNENWACLRPIWKKLDEVLVAKYGVRETFKAPIPIAGPPLPGVLDEIARKADAAITAIGN